MKLICLDPVPYANDDAMWAALHTHVLPWFDGVRMGYPVQDSGAIEGRSIDRAFREITARWPGGAHILYHHAASPDKTDGWNTGMLDRVQRRILANQGRHTVEHILINEPRAWAESGSGTVSLGYVNWVTRMMPLLPPGSYIGTAHGWFHDPMEYFDPARELERCRNRAATINSSHGYSPIAGNYYVKDEGSWVEHPLEQLRRKLAYAWDTCSEFGIYPNPDAAPRTHAMQVALGMQMIEDSLGTATLYQSGTPDDPEDAAKGFSLLGPDLMPHTWWKECREML